MKYQNIVKAKFISRPNRFIANVEVPGQGDAKAHVKNTGRCRELLIPGATVYLEDFEGRMGTRKMRYSLIGVEKETPRGMLMINMDSQAPNKVVHEALASGKLVLPGMDGQLTLIKPEKKYGDSRFDFYIESTGPAAQSMCLITETQQSTSPAAQTECPATEGQPQCTVKRAFAEVKGVTLETDGHAAFPDAPTERGLKHINELIHAKAEGYEAYIIFVVQMKPMIDMKPNWETHEAFGQALRNAKAHGVEIIAFQCDVTEDELTMAEVIPVSLER